MLTQAERRQAIVLSMTLRFMEGLEVVLKIDGNHACIGIGCLVIGLGNFWIPIQIRSQIQIVSQPVHTANAEGGVNLIVIARSRPLSRVALTDSLQIEPAAPLILYPI